MLKKHAKKFALLQRIVDIASVSAAWMLSYYIRFHFIPGAQSGLFTDFLGLTPYLAVITVFFYTRNNLYLSNRFFSWHKEVFAIVKSNVQAISTFFMFLYITTRVRFSRITLILYPLIVIIISVVIRLIIRRILMNMRRRGKNLRHLLLVGQSEGIEKYIKTLNLIPESGVRVTGWIDSGGLAEKYGIKEITFNEFLGNTAKPDMVVIGYMPSESEKINFAVNFFNQQIIATMIIPNIQYDYLGFDLEEFEGIPLIAVNTPKISMTGEMVKRLADVVGSLTGLILLSPVFIIISILVKLTSRGPVFYGQERMSIDGTKFTMWKFRSMKTDAENKSGAVWAKKNDDRKTIIGSFLRKTSLDEIPQFWNVLKGEMSLVGPRPERPMFVEQFKKQIPEYMLRHRVKAGMTGWAQINGWRGDTSIEKRIEFDLYYIKHWNLMFDVKILLLTFVKGFVNENAY